MQALCRLCGSDMVTSMSVLETKAGAMVLAAGLGTRMRPLTLDRPKPLIDVAGKPLIEYAFDLLREAGIHKAVVNRHYLSDQIKAYAAQVKGVQVETIHEAQLLETGGGIKNALPIVSPNGEPFFVLNSDTICLSAAGSPALQEIQRAAKGKDITLLLMPRHQARGYDGAGDFIIDEEAKRFRRRRADDAADAAAMVFTGVQLLSPSIFTDSPDGAFSMNVIYNRYFAQDGWSNDRIAYVVHRGKWLHVGDPAARDAAEEYLQETAFL